MGSSTFHYSSRSGEPLIIWSRLQPTTKTSMWTQQKVFCSVERKSLHVLHTPRTKLKLPRSAGATAAITVSHQLRDEGVFPALTGLYLAAPGPCRIAELPEKYRLREKSWEQNKDAPIFNKAVSDFLACKLFCMSMISMCIVLKFYSIRTSTSTRSPPLTSALEDRT
jgi:hypothetical protein